MGKTDSRISRVHTLTARTGRTESILADIVHIQVNVKFVSFREDCHGCGRSLDTALSLSLRHTLHTMHA